MNGTNNERVKLLLTISRALEALASDCEQIDKLAHLVDFGASMNGIAQRAEKIADCVKARLWSIRPNGGDLAGVAYRVSLVSSTRAVVDVTSLRNAYPKIAADLTHDQPLRQAHFAPK